MRLVSLAPSNTDILFELGLGLDIVAITTFCKPPPGQMKKVLPGWSTLKVDQVTALDPDLVLTSSVVQEKFAAQLKAAGLKVMHLDPRNIDEVWDSALEIGQALGREEEAHKKIVEWIDRWNKLSAGALRENRPRVYVEEWHDPPMASGNWVPDLVAAAGGETWPGMPAGKLSGKISKDELRTFDPQIVIHSICGISLNWAPSNFHKTGGREGLSASASGNIFTIDDSLLNTPSWRLIEGLELVQNIIGECAWGWPRVEAATLRRI